MHSYATGESWERLSLMQISIDRGKSLSRLSCFQQKQSCLFLQSTMQSNFKQKGGIADHQGLLPPNSPWSLLNKLTGHKKWRTCGDKWLTLMAGLAAADMSENNYTVRAEYVNFALDTTQPHNCGFMRGKILATTLCLYTWTAPQESSGVIPSFFFFFFVY